jgi:hypothetical protein
MPLGPPWCLSRPDGPCLGCAGCRVYSLAVSALALSSGRGFRTLPKVARSLGRILRCLPYWTAERAPDLTQSCTVRWDTLRSLLTSCVV